MGKIMVSGEGGQGVRLIAHAMATLLANLGYQVTLLYDYDSAVRGAMSLAHVTFDKGPIDNPVIDAADILLELSDKVQGLHAAKTICAARRRFLSGSWGWSTLGGRYLATWLPWDTCWP